MVEITVVIVTCNREKEFKRAVLSIVEQKDISLELINIDNNSSDGTKDLMEELKNDSQVPIKNIFLSENVGPTLARRLGFEEARGEIVYFLDDDAYLKDQFFLAKLKTFMKENPEVGCVQTGIFDTQLEGYMKPRHQRFLTKNYFLAMSFIGASYAFRRNVTKGFEEKILFPDWIFSRSEEFYSAVRLYDFGYLVAYFPDIEVVHQPSPSMRPSQEDMQLTTIINKHSIRKSLYPRLILPLSFFALLLRLGKHYGWNPGSIFSLWKKSLKVKPSEKVPRISLKTFLFLTKKFSWKSVI